MSTVSTVDGIVIDPLADIWILPGRSSTRTIDFSKLNGLAASWLCDAFRNALAQGAARVVGSTLFNWFDAFRHLLALGVKFPVMRVDLSLVLGWRSAAEVDIRTRRRLHVVRPIIKRWHALGLPGVEGEAAKALATIRIKTEAKGVPVRTSDPTNGPFTDIEIQGIVSALRNGSVVGTVTVEDYALVWLFLALGVRPIQIASIKCGDLLIDEAPDGSRTYLLKVSRAKQRGAGLRSAFKTRALVSEIGHAVVAQVEEQRRRWAITGLAEHDIPLFGQSVNGSWLENSLHYHPTTEIIGRKLDRLFASLDVRSERTGERLHVSSRRFRYTKGTRLAAAGATTLVIAEALDHSDTSCVTYYVEAVPAILERIDKAVAMSLAPMAQAFLGQIIENEAQALRAGDLTSRIRAAASSPVGSCGSFGFCGAMAPVACYTCRSFQPWLDGPHEEVLESLLAERERILTAIGDTSVAGANDRTIIACAEVVRLCAERREPKDDV